MAITINGTGSITGLTAGGLPDGSITSDDIASSAFATLAQKNGTHTTGSITSGTTALTVASGTGISNGDYVVGEGITPGTTVSSGGGTTSITLSANANATLSSNPVAFYSATKLLSPALVGGQLCRAWVNFNGTSTVDIRASYNVSSITDNGTGDYTVNFTTAMVDANYATIATAEPSTVPAVGATFYTVIGAANANAFSRTTTSAAIKTAYVSSLGGASTSWDSQGTHVAIFR
jgi:hypothetical protein